MGASEVLLLLALLCAICGAATAILITAALDRRGLTTPFPLIGFFLLRNVARYRQMTIAASGHAGPLSAIFVASMVAALVLALLGLLTGVR